MFMKSILTAAVIAAGVSMASAADISGAGATFPFPIYAKWADAYKKDTGNGLNYQSIGSGAGIKQIKAKTVTFGATDAPLKPDELDKDRPRAVADGDGRHRRRRQSRRREAGRLPSSTARPSPTSISARSPTGTIPALKALNPKLDLPNLPIVPIHRADGSGTTFNFTYYLGEVSPEWKDKVGVATTVDWPGGIGAKGNDGVANNVATTKGAIGYVEYAYAKQNKLTYAIMVNKAGKVGRPDAGSLPGRGRQRRLGPCAGLLPDPGQSAGRQVVADDRRHLHPDAQGSPDKAAARTTRSTSSSGPTRRAARWPQDLDYIPMPDNVVKLVEAMWAKDIKLEVSQVRGRAHAFAPAFPLGNFPPQARMLKRQ